jgi:TonB-linked SusC/RagA family outer membrane protein
MADGEANALTGFNALFYIIAYGKTNLILGIMNKFRLIRTGLILLLLLFSNLYCAISQIVTGNVTDESGEALPGVAVIIKGTTAGVITDLDGNYSITVDDPGNTILEFSYVGMETQEIFVGSQTRIDITLKIKSEYLDEIVVIGYGSVRKRDLTGAVSSVSSNQLKDMPATSAAAAITGRLAGVHVVTAEGSPDAEVKVRVRGGGSITQDNSPLFIIDGFPAESMSDIPPTDIASIDVLKDASSTAIYGARGANGVIIITTKSGSAGKVKIDYNYYTGIKKLSNKLPVLSPFEFVLNQYDRAASGSFLDLRSFTELFGTYDQLDSLYVNQEGIDWQEEVFGRDATVSNHNLSIYGGSEKSKYNMSLSHIDDQGIMIESGYKRSNLNFRFENKASDKITLHFDAKLSDTKILGAGTSDPGSSTNNRLKHTLIYRPVNGLVDFSDDPELEFDEDEYYESSRLIDPVTLVKDEYRMKHRTYATLNGSFRYNFLKNFEYRMDLGFDNRQERREEFDGISTPNARKYGDKPIVTLEERRNVSLRLANLLNYKTNLNDSHNIHVLLGQEMIHRDYKNFSAESRSFPEDITPSVAIGSMELGEDNQKPSTFEGLNRLLSFFSRVNYGFRDKYLASFTIRADGSSKFGPGNRWGVFPSGSVAWRISEESFMQSIDFISNLKLRMSYGQAGNNRIGDFLWTTTYNVGSDKAFYLNEVPLTFLYPATLANPNLKWETTITRNAGLDFGVFNSRLNLTVDVYKNSTVDLLIRSRIPSVSGYEEQMRNIGETTNYGTEFILDAYIIEKDDFRLSSNFNISFNRNRVENLGGMEYYTVPSDWISDTGDDFIVKVGEPVGLMYGFVTDGFYTVDDFDYDEATETYTLKEGVADNSGITFGGDLIPGAVRFKDIEKPLDESGEPITDDNSVTFDEDRVVIGNANPKHLGGLNIMAGYKGIDLSIFVNWVYGNDIYNANKIEFTSVYRKYTNSLTYISSDKRWRNVDEDGNVVTDPAILSEINKNASIWSPSQGRYLFHSWAVEDGSFLRINNITLGYTLPAKWTNKIFVKQFRIYATVNNLHTFTRYTGYDPEVDTRRSTPLTPGVDYSAYPRSTTFIFGLNLTL